MGESRPHDPKRGPNGQFLKGVHRQKGSKTKIPRTLKEVLNRVAEKVGLDGNGTDARVGFFEKIARTKPEVVGGWIVHGSLPKAKKTDDNGGGHVGNVIINIVAHGCFLTAEEARRVCGGDLALDNKVEPEQPDEHTVLDIRDGRLRHSNDDNDDGAA